jgi:hypothetical protein
MSQEQPGRKDADAPVSATGDDKRRAARRRFLMRGAAGSGVVIVTLYHTRTALAKKKSVIYTSSPEFCLSLKGTPSQKKTLVPSPDNPTKKIPAYECVNVPDYKVPWVPQQKK